MEVSPARLALYIVQIAGIAVDVIGWRLQEVAEVWAVPALVILAATLFLSIYSDNQNADELERLRTDLRGLGKDVAFLMKPHKRRRDPPN